MSIKLLILSFFNFYRCFQRLNNLKTKALWNFKNLCEIIRAINSSLTCYMNKSINVKKMNYVRGVKEKYENLNIIVYIC